MTTRNPRKPKCEWCGAEIALRPSSNGGRQRQYCDGTCSKAAWRHDNENPTEKRERCKWCDKPIYQLDRGRPREFCDRTCASRYHAARRKVRRKEQRDTIRAIMEANARRQGIDPE